MPSDLGRLRGPIGRGFALAFVALQLGLFANPGEASVARVAVVQSSRLGPFEEAVGAIVGELRQGPLQPEVLTFDLGGDASSGDSVLERVREAAPRVVIAVGSLATSVVLKASPALASQIVFAMVLYPEASGFLGVRNDVTGASLDVPYEVQFDYVRQLLPKAKRIGVLYSPGETGALIEKARKAARRSDLELVAESVEEPSRVPAALDGLMQRIDALWTVADGQVFTSQTTPAILLSALRHRVPVIGLSLGQVKSGALATFLVDYGEVGRQAADLAARILGGADADRLPVTHPREISLALNLKTAELLDLQLPEALVERAEEVVR
jgi:putative tryptophan/tyrosine transport system substrate-binding protein